jgi:predicted lactoylglutathione lyase
MPDKHQFNIYLPQALIRKVKHAAIERDRSLSLFVEGLLSAELDRDAPLPAGISMTLMHIVHVRRMAESLSFYRALGLAPRHEGPRWSELSVGDAVLALHRAEEKSSGTQAMALAFATRARLETLVARLRSAGIRQPLEIADKAYGRSITVRDPDGHPIRIDEHDPGLHKIE